MARRRGPPDARLTRLASPSLSVVSAPPYVPEGVRGDAWVDCGWGRLFFGQTFTDHDALIRLFASEPPGRRDLAMYVWEHHVLLGKAPELLFVDPSVQYRLWLYHYRAPKRRPGGFFIRPLASREDGAAQNRIYRACGMMTVDPDIVLANQRDSPISYFLAVDSDDGTILATITVIDHVAAFADAENGASFWCLAVNPKRRTAGVGKSLVRHAVEHLHAKGREYLDLSVLHDNRRAIRLYQSLGFQRIPVYVVKRRNRINKPLYSGGAQP